MLYKIVICLLLLSAICCLHLYAELYGTENFAPDPPAPDFLASFYDNYSNNYLNTRLLGMGSTAVAIRGGIENAIFNPAAMNSKSLQVYLEGGFKGNTTEISRFASYDNTYIHSQSQYYETPIPALLAGFSFSPYRNISLGYSFATPQTIKYNVFGRALKTGAFLDRYPTMLNYQNTFSAAGHINNLSIGLNLIHNYYTFRDYRIEYSFDRVNFEESTIRYQPGIFYEHKYFTLGASYKTSVTQTIKVANSPQLVYAKYETTFPPVLELGSSFNIGDDTIIAAAFEYEETSKQSKLFDDRIRTKIGIEKTLATFSIRGGLISVPDIYNGSMSLLEDKSNPQADEFYKNEYDYFMIEKSNQLSLTGGLTFFTPKADFSIAFLKDLLNNADIFQLTVGVNIKLGTKDK